MKTEFCTPPRNWQKLEYHPLSEWIEFESGLEVDQLVAFIREHGYDQDEAIILYEGKILDGRHKHAACVILGITPTFKRFVGKSASAYVAKKAHRQHLGKHQCALIAANLAKAQAQICASPAQIEAAKTMGVSRRTVQMATKVIDKGTPELLDAVKAGEVSISDAANVADAPKRTQRRAVADVRGGRARTASAAVEPTSDAGGPTGEPSTPKDQPPPRPQVCPHCRQPWGFERPTEEDVAAYCVQRKNGINPKAFIAYYEANGWHVGKRPMKDWKSAVRYWEQLRKERNGKPAQNLYAGLEEFANRG